MKTTGALMNITQNLVIAKSPRVASDVWTRARGMIGRRFEGFDALILPYCSSVHTWFMKQTLDLIFLNRKREILSFKIKIKPWSLVFGPRGSDTVIELPPGTLCGISISRHDILNW